MMKKLFVAAALTFTFAAGTASAEEAAELWKAKCKSCHGATGKADTREGRKQKIDDISTAEWQAKHSDDEIRKVITEGKKDTKMKAYKDKLSAQEIDSLVAYIRTLKQ